MSMFDIRIGRCLRLLTLLRAKTGRRARDLAAECEVSERTVYRDLRALSAAGAAVRFDKESGRYEIAGDFFLPPVQLTLGEALALSAIGSQLGKRGGAAGGGVPFLQDAWQAVTKVRSQLPAALREEVAESDEHIHIQAARVSPQEGCAAYFETFRRAIGGTRKVRCTYATAGGGGDGRRPFLFRPYSLFFCQRAWYAIGHSERAGGERSLKLNRLTAAEATDFPYRIPDGWTLEKSLGKAWRMIRGDRRHAVRIVFDGDFGRNAADTLWHSTQRVVWQPDGSCLFTCEVDGLDEIVWWVLGYGPHARVIEPRELRERVRQLAEEMRALYAPAGLKAVGVGG